MTDEEKRNEVNKLIEEARAKRYIGPPTEVRYWSKKLDFFWKWDAGRKRYEECKAQAKAQGYEFHAYHTGTGDFEWEWKVETGEIKLYASH